ncbi:hypothetical protein CEXT_523241 [Caerostris extrusa]|uniref:Uncharacterized protein n=1 Tax=Caerostris extrusa TaxID=172846 RepID=A0AAV4RS83_CAEEX|nr:hypothetical protein CEXT_523241 [Caerostris extrusa]
MSVNEISFNNISLKRNAALYTWKIFLTSSFTSNNQNQKPKSIFVKERERILRVRTRERERICFLQQPKTLHPDKGRLTNDPNSNPLICPDRHLFTPLAQQAQLKFDFAPALMDCGGKKHTNRKKEILTNSSERGSPTNMQGHRR